jgi:hypothetical protein
VRRQNLRFDTEAAVRVRTTVRLAARIDLAQGARQSFCIIGNVISLSLRAADRICCWRRLQGCFLRLFCNSDLPMGNFKTLYERSTTEIEEDEEQEAVSVGDQ